MSYLDLYGGLREPRAKEGQSAIQWQEMAKDGAAVVHPRRSVFALGPPSQEEMQKMQEARQSVVLEGRRYKWIIDSDGALVVGPAEVTEKEWVSAEPHRKRAYYLGHTTLIGGMKPEGCIGGEWYLETTPDGKGKLVIDNNSGRYSEFTHLESQHLENVAHRFEQLGCPVECKWIDMLARREERKAMKAARAAATAAAAEALALPGAGATNEPH